MTTLPLVATLGAASVAGMGLVAEMARRRQVHRWLVPYLLDAPRIRRRPGGRGPVHLLLCVADHFEPHRGGVSQESARERVQRWLSDYPRQLGSFRDSDGRSPRHTFFYPIDEYDADSLDSLGVLCRQGFGEVEIHLHHDHDTSEALRDRLVAFRDLFHGRHGLLPRHRETGELKYGFIHGNWALDNSRPDGRWCGVNNELDVLRETGCYADFTLPSAPSATQTRTINSIYYACDDPRRPKSHDRGTPVGTGPAPSRSLMLIQGPLLLNWRRRVKGIFPRIENGCIQASQPPTAERLALWLRARVQVARRRDWYFVKLHTHGAEDANRRVLLGEPMMSVHRALAERAGSDANFQYHYVTAREMYNLARAAEAGYDGPVDAARDYEPTLQLDPSMKLVSQPREVGPLATFKLSAQDRKDLEDLLVEAIPSAERQRLQALLWRDDGESAEWIAERMNVSRQTVYNWCHRFVAKEGQTLKTRLADAPRKGRPRIGGGRIGILIAPLLADDPHKWGYQSTHWNLTLLCQFLKDQHGIVASAKTVRRAADRLRIPWKTLFAGSRTGRRLDADQSPPADEPPPPPPLSPANEIEP